MESHKNLFLGALLSIGSFFCLSSTNTMVKLLGGQIPIFQLLFLQNIVGLVAMCLICILQKKTLSFYQSNHYGLLLFRTLVGIGIFLFLFISVQYVSVTNATLLVNTAPLFIPFILLFGFAEKIDHRLWAGIIPGFIGIALILNPGANIFQWHALLALISGGCMAGLYIVLRQLHRNHEPMTRVLVYLFTGSALLTLPFALLTWKSPTAHEWFLLGLISASSFCAQSLMTLSLRYGSPGALAPLCYTAVLFSLLYDWLLWDNLPTWIAFLGIVLVMVGGVIALVLERKKLSKPL
jgi:drug/metabolite transporter (DMT)-like permease